jgi:rubrerythrin
VQEPGGDETEVHGAHPIASRRGFVAGAAASGLAAFLAACGSKAGSKSQTPLGGHDLEIVNYALTLEHVEADFYDKVVEAGLFQGVEAALFRMIQSHEHEHVAALQALARMLGGPVADRPQTHFQLGSARAAVTLAATLENTGAAAYLGQVDSIENKEVLAQAVSIHSIEARHAAKLNRLAGDDFAPDGAFASPMTTEEVLGAVGQFIA